MSHDSSRVDALIEGTDRTSRRRHTSSAIVSSGLEQAMADALRDILRDEARRDAPRH